MTDVLSIQPRLVGDGADDLPWCGTVTVADLDESTVLGEPHVAEALELRGEG